MKPLEAKALKDEQRVEIDRLRTAIYMAFRKIPIRVINGYSNDVRAYLDAVKAAAGDYHLKHGPGESNTLDELANTRSKLTIYLKAIT